MHLARVSPWAYPRMEIFPHPGVTTSTQHEPAFGRDFKVEAIGGRFELVFPAWPNYASTVVPDDNFDEVDGARSRHRSAIG